MKEVLVYGLRIALLFCAVYFVLRVSGKKNVSAMSVVDLMGIILIAAMAAEPLVSDSAIKTLFGVAVVVVMQVGLGRLEMVNALSPYIQQQPTVLVRQGKVDRLSLLRVQMSLEQLLAEIRQKGFLSIEDVEYVILEPSGRVSVLPRANARPVTPRDLGLSVPYDGLALPLVLDGTVIRPNLRYAGVSEEWLLEQLRARGFASPGEAFLVELNTHGVLTVQAQPGEGGEFFAGLRGGPGGSDPVAGWQPPLSSDREPPLPP